MVYNFFNPENGTIVSSIDFTFQPNVTSGARFGYKYQSGTAIYRLDVTTAVYAPTFPLDSQVLVHSHAPPHKATIIGTPSYSRSQTTPSRDENHSEERPGLEHPDPWQWLA